MKKNLLMKKIAITTCNIRFICKYMLHLCTIKSPTSSAFISSKGNSYHALEKCEGVKGAKFLFFISFFQSVYF